MPPRYSYTFLPKNRERALKAALIEFRECRKQAKTLEQGLKDVNQRMDFIGRLLGFGTQGGVPPDEELQKRIEAVLGEA